MANVGCGAAAPRTIDGWPIASTELSKIALTKPSVKLGPGRARDPKLARQVSDGTNT
jgi:hypothetical protein